MTTQLFPVELIEASPYQTRTHEDTTALQALADSIAEKGLLQPPTARPHPSKSGHFQLVFGHRRFAAWKLAEPGEPFPLEIKPLSDREMSDQAATENSEREDLSAIEVAQAIQRRVDTFKITQLEAGRPFGLSSAGGVSNILRLLKLSAAVQDAVKAGQIAERTARQFLIVERVNPKQSAKLLERVVSAENQEEAIHDVLEELLDKRGRSLGEVPWEMDWPQTPEVVETAHGPLTLRACIGCPQFIRRNLGGEWKGDLCAGWDCYDEKLKRAHTDLASKRSAALKIPVATPGEKVTVIYDGRNWQHKAGYERLVKKPTAELRLVPMNGEKDGHYDRNSVLGTPWLALATVDKTATEGALKAAENKPAPAAKPADAKPKQESEKQRSERIAAEEKEALARRAARSKFNKEKRDTVWLIESAAHLIAERLEMRGAIAQFAEAVFTSKFSDSSTVADFPSIDERLVEAVKNAEGNEQEILRRQRLVVHVLIEKLIGYKNAEEACQFGRVRNGIADICGPYKREVARDGFSGSYGMTARFGVSLPDGWDAPPIHKTEFNCHVCGVFAPGERITQRDLAAGWVVESAGGKVVAVRCPECAAKPAKASFTKPAPKPGAVKKSKAKGGKA